MYKESKQKKYGDLVWESMIHKKLSFGYHKGVLGEEVAAGHSGSSCRGAGVRGRRASAEPAADSPYDEDPGQIRSKPEVTSLKPPRGIHSSFYHIMGWIPRFYYHVIGWIS